jgi:hypothetical protein
MADRARGYASDASTQPPLAYFGLSLGAPTVPTITMAPVCSAGALESHQGDVLRAISRRTPNADEGHLRLRRRLTEQARCAIKAPRVADGVRRLAGGMARAYRYQAGPNLSPFAARPAERFAYNWPFENQRFSPCSFVALCHRSAARPRLSQ